MEIVKSKRVGVIVFLLSLIFLGLASCAFGQSELDREHRFDNKDITTLSLKKPLKFSSENGHDTDYVNIMVDSVSVTEKKYRMFIYFSDSDKVAGTIIKVGFKNGELKEFKPSRIVVSKNYAEYELTKDDVYTFLISRYDSFGFFSKKEIAVSTYSVKSDYFMNFIRNTN